MSNSHQPNLIQLLAKAVLNLGLWGNVFTRTRVWLHLLNQLLEDSEISQFKRKWAVPGFFSALFNTDSCIAPVLVKVFLQSSSCVLQSACYSPGLFFRLGFHTIKFRDNAAWFTTGFIFLQSHKVGHYKSHVTQFLLHKALQQISKQTYPDAAQ